MECRFFKPLKKLVRKIGVPENGGKHTVFDQEIILLVRLRTGKRLLVRVIGRFEKNQRSRNRDSTVYL